MVAFASLGCADLAPIDEIPPATDAGLDENIGGEGEGETPPTCDDPVDLWPDARWSFCEDDADICDLTGDAPNLKTDIVQVWSDVEDDAFTITLRVVESLPGDPVDYRFLVFFFVFDVDGETRASRTDEEYESICAFPLGYRTNLDIDPIEYDGRLMTLYPDEFVIWGGGDESDPYLGTTLPFDCSTDLEVVGPYVRARFPRARVSRPDGSIVYSVFSQDSGLNQGAFTMFDLGAGACTWVESTGGVPDVDIPFSPLGPCGAIYSDFYGPLCRPSD